MAALRVFADTNTLYPFYVCDLLLHCAEEDLFEILWSDDLFAELIKIVSRSGRKSAPVVERMCAAIREAFPDGEIPRKAYDHLINEMPGRIRTTMSTRRPRSADTPTSCLPTIPRVSRQLHCAGVGCA